MASDSVVCVHCGQSYKRGALRAGARVTCKKCGKAFVVDAPPSAPELPEPEVPAAEPAPEPRPARQRFVPAPKPARSKTPLLIGAAVLVVGLGIGIYALTRGKTPEPGKPAGGAPQAAQDAAAKSQPEPPKPKVGKELYQDLLAQATAAPAGEDKVKHLKAAAAATTGAGWADAAEADKAKEAAFQKILEVDPDNEFVNATVRGLVKYMGMDKSQAGKWVKPEEVRTLDEQFLARRDEERRKADEEALVKRWEKDAWTRKAKRVADANEKLMPEGMKLTFVFDRPRVPRPYFLMVEDVPSPDPIATADTMGPGLNALRNAFKERYKHIIPGAGEENDKEEMKYVIPVLILASVESYKKYRKGREYLPSEGLAGAFYVSRSPTPDDYKGMLYVWQGYSEKVFHETVFHEATHQLMHYASSSEGIGQTPWLQEGIAEFFGAYERKGEGVYEFGKILEGRKRPCKQASRNYFDTEEGEREEKKGGGYLTPRQLVAYDRMNFERSKAILEGRSKTGNREQAQHDVGLIYAQGWGLIHFCNTFEDGKYRKGFEEFLAKELREEASPDDFGEALKLKNDEDWHRFSEEFFTYCHKEYR